MSRSLRGLARLALLVLACVMHVPVAAQVSDLLGGFLHSQWRAEDGAPADIRSMAQGIDGWLWIGTTGGLYRFDGVRFERALGPLGNARIHELYAAPTGDLYVGLRAGGVSVLHPDGRVEELPGSDGPTLGTISSMALDSDGSLWAMGNAIYRWRGQKWQLVDNDPVWRSSNLRSLVLDDAGALWVAHDGGVKRLNRGSGIFADVDRDGGGSLTIAPDGSVWLLPKQGNKVRRIAAASAGHVRNSRFNPSGSRFAGMFDGNGALWKLHCPASICVAAFDAKQSVLSEFDNQLATAPQLSGAITRQILEDREGNIWLATQRGLDRFRSTRLARLSLPASESGMTMAADSEGHVWVSDVDSGQLWQISARGEARLLPSPPVSMVVADHDGGVLIAGKRSIWRESHGRRTEIALPPGPDGKPHDRRLFALVDDGKIIWAAAPDTSLIGWVDGKWRPSTDFKLDDKLYLLAAGGPGQLWLARAGGELLHYDNDKLSRFDASQAGLITGIFPGKEITVGGDGGVGVLIGNHLQMFRTNNANILRGVSGMVTTAAGDRWLNGAAGVIHVRAADWQRAVADATVELRYELFDATDGYPGRALIERSLPTALSGDGRLLWFIGTEGIVSINTAGLRRNPVRPVPSIQNVTSERGVFAASSVLLGAGTQRFSVSYTAPALRLPERIRFEYKLDGYDGDWQDAGVRRSAGYTSVPPGQYRFRVRAFNEDGLASADEAGVPIHVEATLAQTRWFQALSAIFLALAAIAIYRYRLRYVTARLIERLQVKTAERERIARAMHDSFLQSLFALLMRIDAVTSRAPKDSATRNDLEAIAQQARAAIAEGRGQVADLRAGDTADFVGMLEQSLQAARPSPGGPSLSLHIEGPPRALHRATAEEAHDIAREAVRNALRHAQATSIDVLVSFGKRRLTIAVADNGRGIDDALLRAGGRAGHWGLAGMRERAAALGGKLSIEARLPSGTRVVLQVPAKRAYGR